MFVKPAPNLVIRDPDRLDLIPAEGRKVPDNHDYWIRRLRDGDVVECEEPSEDPPAPDLPADNEQPPAVEEAKTGDAAEAPEAGNTAADQPVAIEQPAAAEEVKPEIAAEASQAVDTPLDQPFSGRSRRQ